MNEQLKKLTGKDKSEYVKTAQHLVDDCDVELFKELVEMDNFLFDFIKQNVAERIYNAVNETNYKNLLEFFQYYSPSYDEAIVSALSKFADEDLTDEVLDLFETGSENEKCYCAKFFSYIQDTLAIDLLRENSYTENESLNANCAATLGIMKDNQSYEDAIKKLEDNDDFVKLSAVRFLVMYGDKNAINPIINSLKISTMSENIAGIIPYLMSLQELFSKDFYNGLLVFNNIINGLGEIIGLYEVINFEIYTVIEDLLSHEPDGAIAAVLLNSLEKFNTLTENDEYLFDEDKNTKDEIKDIKKLLSKVNKNRLKELVTDELKETSPFVYTALDYTDNAESVRNLLRCSNQTLILKTAEILKKLNAFDDTSRTVALLKITDENIKSILRAL